MPPRNRNRRRPGRRPNVFVQTEEPTARRQQPEQPEETIAAPSAVASAPAPRNISATPNRPQTANPRRTQRTRSEVYARTFPLEIRKMGIIATGIIVALAVFTIAL